MSESSGSYAVGQRPPLGPIPLAPGLRRPEKRDMRFRWKWPGKNRFLMLLSETLGDWMKHRTLRLGAALAFYTVLSLPPLLVVVLSITGLVFGREAAQDRLVAQFGNLLGAGGRRFFDEMLSYASRPKEGILASSLGLVVL